MPTQQFFSYIMVKVLQEVNVDMELPNKVYPLMVLQGVCLKDNQEEFHMVPLGEYLLNSTLLFHPTHHRPKPDLNSQLNNAGSSS
jgi:hypothetical protein